MRKPSPSQRRIASATRARQASTAFPTVTVTSARNAPNSSPDRGAPGLTPGAAGAADRAVAAAAPSSCFAASALIGWSFTAWNATSRLSAPISSRTLANSRPATVSRTPG